MSKKLTELNGEFAVTHQAICRSGDFDGPLQTDINEAYRDASRHRHENGNQHHETNSSDGSEFLDDAIRMKDQPLEEKPIEENQQTKFQTNKIIYYEHY